MYLVIKIISFVIRIFSIKPDQFVRFIFDPYIEFSTVSIRKTGYCFKPSYNILTI